MAYWLKASSCDPLSDMLYIHVKDQGEGMKHLSDMLYIHVNLMAHNWQKWKRDVPAIKFTGLEQLV